MVLLRKVIGDVLRARRLAQRRTLREVSAAANVSLGYLSEIERGHKEASSELLAAVCDALGTGLSDVLADVATTFALAEQMADAFSRAQAEAPAVAVPSALEDSVTDGSVTVSVRSDGPLRTTLTARRSTTPARAGGLSATASRAGGLSATASRAGGLSATASRAGGLSDPGPHLEPLLVG